MSAQPSTGWKIMAAAGPVMAALSLLIAALGYNKIQDNRAIRTEANGHADFIVCERSNHLGAQNRNQDQLLSDLIEGTLKAGLHDANLRSRFELAERNLNTRINSYSPTACGKLPTAKPISTR